MTHPIPDAALARATAIVGTTGAGKSYAARSAVEGLLDQGRRVCVVDPTGVWYGLRTSAGGTGPGFPVVIFGGDHADVLINEHAGERLAEIVATRGLSCVVDISELGIGDRHRFMTDFLGSLYTHNRTALHLILDEADELAPQQPLPETKRLLHATDRIIRRGRVRGFRPMLITQRPAVIHKNVLSQIGCLIAMKLTSPQDRKAIEDWVQGHADAKEAKAVFDTLAKLKTGEGWVWWPEGGVLERTKFPPIRTFDSSRAPDDDEAVEDVRPLAPVEVDELRDLIATEPEPEAPARVRVEYRTDPAALKAEWQRGFEAGQASALDGMAGWVAERRAAPVPGLPLLTVEEVRKRMEAPDPAPGTRSLTKAAVKAEPAPKPRREGTSSGADTVFAAVPANTRLTWLQVALLAGYHPEGGYFRRAKRDLIDAGRAVEEPGGFVIFPDGPGPAINAPATWVEAAQRKLGTLAGGLLARLVAERLPIYRSDLAARQGYAETGGYYRRALKELRDWQLIVQSGDTIAPAPWLFGEGQ